MTQQSCVAGIDVSKLSLDVVVLPRNAHSSFINDRAGIRAIATQLRGEHVGCVVLEATGGLEYRLARGLADAGLRVHRVNPERIHSFRRTLGLRAKTDKLDAGLIARFAQMMDLPDRPVPSEADQDIETLGTRRRQLVEMAAAERNRLKQATGAAIVESLRRSLAALLTERARIEAALLDAIRANPATLERYQILLSIPGIGPVAASTLVTDMPELGQVDRRAIASLAPHPQQSGTSQNGHSLRGGRSCVRVALYMAALSASRRSRPPMTTSSRGERRPNRR